MNRRAFMAALMGSAVAPKMPSAKWIGMDRSRGRRFAAIIWTDQISLQSHSITIEDLRRASRMLRGLDCTVGHLPYKEGDIMKALLADNISPATPCKPCSSSIANLQDS